MANFKGSKPATKGALQEVLHKLTSLRNDVYLLSAPGAPGVEEELRNLDSLLGDVAVSVCVAIERAEKTVEYS